MKFRTLIAVTMFPLTLFGQSIQIATEIEKEAIAAVAERFSAAYMRGDVETMMDCYAREAAIFPAGMDIVSHRDSIRKYWTLAPGRKMTRHKSTAVNITIEGTTAFDHGYFEGASSRDGGEPVSFRGKYVIVWVKESDGKWRMKLDIWNAVR